MSGPTSDSAPRTFWLRVEPAARIVLWLVIGAALLLRLHHLGADFTTDREFSRDGVLYSDEGWYAGNALAHFRTGHWYRPGEMNFAVNLPVLQVLHGVTFALLGPDIISARLTITAAFLVLAGLFFCFLRRHLGEWPALLALFWLSTNHFGYLFSRFAIAEMPMTMLAVLSLLAMERAVTARRAAWAGVSGVLWVLAFLTKSSALFAGPLLALWALSRWHEGRGAALARLGVLGAAVVLGVGAHYLLLARTHPEDYAYFHTLNVGMNARTSAAVVVDYALHQLDKVRILDSALFRALVLLVPALLVLSREFRRSLVVRGALLWIFLYLLMFSFYVNLRPRYWSPLLFPVGLLLAAALRELWALRDRFPRVAPVLQVALVLLVLVAAGRSVKETSRYLRKTEYSFARACADMESRMAADPKSRGVLLGHFANSVALYARVLPVNDRFAPTPLEARLEEYRPRFLLTESAHEERDYADQHQTVEAAEGGRRDQALRKYYRTPLRVLRSYDVFDNYNGWPITLYALEPLPDAPWPAAEERKLPRPLGQPRE